MSLVKRVGNLAMSTDRNRELELEIVSREGPHKPVCNPIIATPYVSLHGRKIKFFQTLSDVSL